MFRIRLAVLFCLALAACAPRPATVVLPEAAQVGKVETLLYATTRNPEPAGKYGSDRVYKPLYGQLEVAIPPSHTPGKLEVSGGVPDPKRDFALAGEQRFDGEAMFRARLARQLRARPPGQREVVLFVHGFNVNFAEGAFRLAQLVDDFDIGGVPVYFSWSSAAKVLGYEHDRDSALFARDALERTIKDARAAGAESILLAAHSMGAFLAVETLRQMAIENPALPRRAVNAVVLISPDIDVDVFHSQAWRMGRLPQPFVIFVSTKDRALRLSAMLSGAQHQLGNLKTISQVADLPVTVFNVTKFSNGADLNHFTLGNSPALIRLFRNAGAVNDYIQRDRSGRTGLLPGTVLAVQKATEILLEPLSITQ
ncbi:alpha/beta hydrolase [Acidimangrovimonas pyrenivorans]|uniref:Alpha/beta hydrolase n=1 Tax=Acidimangrovimonas pyrenivorans TaxID=2030798 RepID=A0ABV7AKQ9_9RHOB